LFALEQVQIIQLGISSADAREVARQPRQGFPGFFVRLTVTGAP
jgi:hypothetical protein